MNENDRSSPKEARADAASTSRGKSYSISIGLVDRIYSIMQKQLIFWFSSISFLLVEFTSPSGSISCTVQGSSSSADAARGEKPASESGDESAAGRAAAMQREKSNVLDTVLEEPEDSTAAAAAMAAAGGALEAMPIAEGEQEAAPLEPPVPAEQTDAGEVPQGDESAAVASGEEAPAGVPEDQPAPDAAASTDAQ